MKFNKRSTIFLFALCISFVFPGATFSAPNISNVGGTVLDGHPLIFTGTDFGVHADNGGPEDYLCFQWDDFETGNFDKWSVYQPERWEATTGSDNRANSTYCAKRLPGGTGAIGKTPGLQDVYFYSFYFRLQPEYSLSGLEQCKFLRIYSNYSSPRGVVNLSWAASDAVYWFTDPPGGEQYFFGKGSQITRGAWHKWEIYLKKSSTSSSSDGKIHIWYDGEQKLNNNSYCTHGFSFATIMRISEYNLSSYYIEYDDVYLNFTQARVELGNNSTYSSCTIREIQPQTSWSETSITVTLNQGAYSKGETVYLYVVDADGNVNTSGYPITIGGGGADTTPPGDVTGQNVQYVIEGDKVKLNVNWVNPSDQDYDGTMVRYNICSGAPCRDEDCPQSHNEGAEGCDVTGEPSQGSECSFEITKPGFYGLSFFTYDTSGNFSTTAHISIEIPAEAFPDSPPTVIITQPTSGDTYVSGENNINIAGTASDEIGVSSVTWVNSQGGNGTASGTTNWTISNISLQEGDNVITVTAHDADLNTGIDTLTVTCTYTPPSGTHTEEFGSATGSDYPGTMEDTFINLNEENSSAHEYLNTYTWPQDTVANAIIMNWDLSAIPSSATIQDATLYLYLSGAGGDDLYDLTAHKIINYNPVISACTGYTYNGTNSWTPNSQCYNNVPLAQADIAAAEDTKSINKTYGYKSWSVTNMVQDWVSNQGSNYGMLVNSDPIASSNSNRYFSATESSNPDQRPKLVVTYTVSDISPPQGLDVIAP